MASKPPAESGSAEGGSRIPNFFRMSVADRRHPITRGLDDWELTDETYVMNEPVDGSRILVATDHPRSMQAIAWTRTVNGTRVFCYQGGHDARAYNDPGFRRLLLRGLTWAGGRLAAGDSSARR